MYDVLEAAVLGGALPTGIGLTAQAQSVSGSGVPQQSVPSHPFGPKPSGSNNWKQERYQPPADYATNRAYHRYSMLGMGPRIDSPYFGSSPKSAAHQTAPGNAQGPQTNSAFHRCS
jgi:hypothetical protein